MLDFIKIFILVSVGCCMAQVYADAHTLNSINFKNNNIIINSEAKIKKDIISNNEILLTLKNTQPSEDIKITYDSSDLNNVVVRQNKNDTQITVNAKNAPEMNISGNVSEKFSYNYHLTLYTCLAILLVAFGFKPKKQKSERYRKRIAYMRRRKSRKEQEKIKIAA